MSRRLGPYTLLRCIGSGGMGEVWAAVHVELRMPCAIKLMKPMLRVDPDHACYEGLFLNEANICAQLRHGRIVRVHNAGYIDGQLFIAMDLVDGVNLWELVRTLESRGALAGCRCRWWPTSWARSSRPSPTPTTARSVAVRAGSSTETSAPRTS